MIFNVDFVAFGYVNQIIKEQEFNENICHSSYKAYQFENNPFYFTDSFWKLIHKGYTFDVVVRLYKLGVVGTDIDILQQLNPSSHYSPLSTTQQNNVRDDF